MYAAIDMKSFYASVECVERGLDPLTTNLVVADVSRTEKTICLAVSPSLKSFGIPGRPRLFEVIQAVNGINYQRRKLNRYNKFRGCSTDINELEIHPELEVGYITAVPQMRLYEEYSTRIYAVFLKYFAPEDVHVYSCDEAFIFIEPYLALYHTSPHELVMKVVTDILSETGITATAGIGTNMYLCKIAMDIVAKKMPADENGVRIAELDELSYREKLWEHTPLKDFWGFGNGIASHLERMGIRNMGDICLLSECDDERLYREFGVNAEIIIDHAWGYESCTISDIKAYKPKCRSLSTSQVLSRAYENFEAEIVLKEMTEQLVLKLVGAGCAADQVSLFVLYDVGGIYDGYSGEMRNDHYGRKMPKPLSCTKKTGYTSSTKEIMGALVSLFRSRTDVKLAIKKIGISLDNIIPQNEIPQKYLQFDLFTDTDMAAEENAADEAAKMRERSLQTAVLGIRNKFGKNSLLRGISYQEGATARERNMQIGGHRA